MRIWAIWMFILIAISALTKGISLGFIDYPREVCRGSDAIDLVLLVAWLIWGACTIW